VKLTREGYENTTVADAYLTDDSYGTFFERPPTGRSAHAEALAARARSIASRTAATMFW
jgi:hypothetical protein